MSHPKAELQPEENRIHRSTSKSATEQIVYVLPFRASLFYYLFPASFVLFLFHLALIMSFF